MPTLTDRIEFAIKTNNQMEGTVPHGGPVLTPARTYISPADSYEDELGFDNPTVSFAPGAMRGMWQVNDQQQANVPVTVLTKSGNSSSNSLAAIQGGIPQNPVAPPSVWAAVPQMIVNMKVTGPIMLHANVSVRSSAANDQIAFAVYRDGQLIGNHLTHTLPATASTASLVQLSAIDNPTVGEHIYAMYWSPGAGTLVAVNNYRNLYAINLSPH